MGRALERKPDWLKKDLPDGRAMKRMRTLLADLNLHTICEAPIVPNIGECWGESTATFLILGNICTRRCGFCDVTTGRPDLVDPHEPENVAEAIAHLGIKHAVITMVNRDDLEDARAEHIARTIHAVRRRNPDTTIEVLISELKGREDLIGQVLEAGRSFRHNLETVRRLHRKVRPRFPLRSVARGVGDRAPFGTRRVYEVQHYGRARRNGRRSH